jgi:hypothetical protein
LGFYGERRVGKPSVARDVGFGVVLERAGSKTGTGRSGLYRLAVRETRWNGFGWARLN